MTNTLAELFDRKDQLMERIRRIDDLIKFELEEQGHSDQRHIMPIADAAPAPSAPIEQSATPTGNPAYDKLSWRKKILHHLGQASGKGLTTADLTNVLKAAHHGEWQKPSIATTLFLMERDGLIKMDRSKGRNLHYLPGQEPATSAPPNSGGATH